MQNDNAKFKKKFKERLYRFVLRLIKFVSILPKNAITSVIVNQLLHGDKTELRYLLTELKELANMFPSAILSLKGRK